MLVDLLVSLFGLCNHDLAILALLLKLVQGLLVPLLLLVSQLLFHFCIDPLFLLNIFDVLLKCFLTSDIFSLLPQGFVFLQLLQELFVIFLV